MALTVTKIIKDKKVGDLIYCLWIFMLPALGAFILWAHSLKNTFSFDSTDAGIVTAGIVLICLGWMAAIVAIPLHRGYDISRLVAAHEKEGTTAFLEFIGKEPKYFNVAAYSVGRCIKLTGLAYDGDIFYALWDGSAVQIPFDRIRSWDWRIEGFNTTQVFNASFNIADSVRNANARSAHGAALNSGFFIHVSDVENPSWQFLSTDNAVLSRWDEILEQHKERVAPIPLAVAA